MNISSLLDSFESMPKKAKLNNKNDGKVEKKSSAAEKKELMEHIQSKIPNLFASKHRDKRFHLILNTLHVALRDWTHTDLAKLCRTNKMSISRWLSEGFDFKPARKPRFVSPEMKRYIERRNKLMQRLALKMDDLERPKYPSARLIARECTLRGYPCTKNAVDRALTKAGWKSVVRPTKPMDRDGDAEKRLKFCNDMLKLLKSHPDRLIFSDEKLFDCNDHTSKRQYIPPGGQAAPRKKCAFGPKLHVWGAISTNFRHFVVFPEHDPVEKGKNGQPLSFKVTGPRYTELCLKSWLKADKAKFRNGGAVYFMQDGAGCHRSRVASDFFEANPRINKLKWPARSPDLNPIEHLWGRVQVEVSKRGPRDHESLEQFFHEEIAKIPTEEIDALVESFIERLKKCIKKKGGPL